MRLPLHLTVILYLILAASASAQEVQWASAVLDVSSEHSSRQYSAKQALGKPNAMPQGGDNPSAWRPGKKGKEFIKVGFAQPQQICQVIVCESFNPTAVTKIILYDTDGKDHEIYKSKPGNVKLNARTLSVKFDITSYKAAAVRLELDLSKQDKWIGIDAVGISASKQEYVPGILSAAGISYIAIKENLGERVNSTYSELLPVISPDGKSLFFTRENDPKNIGGKGQDIWRCTLQEDGKWSQSENIGSPLNNEHSNFVSSVTPDGNTLLVGGIYYSDGTMGRGVSLSQRTSAGWSEPEAVPVINYYNKNPLNEFCLSNSGKVLLMAIERNDTYGDKDLYISFMKEDGSWSEPANMGATLNTACAEVSPFLAADERTLYFSTKGFPGYGSNDIFITRRLDSTWTNWSEPQNLGSQLNTPEWDAYYTLTASGDFAYFVSKHRTLGSTDIFRVALPKEVKPVPVVLMAGRVLHSRTKKPVKASITYIDLSDGKEAGIAHSDPATGNYKIVLPAGKEYGFLAQADSFISVNENIDLSDLQEYKEMEQDLFLVPIERGETVRLNNIFFSTGNTELLPSSHFELDRLSEIMKAYGNMEIEIAGHTDNTGSEAINLSISQKRAKAVSDYLISKGVPITRMQVNGYGESKPAASNDTEEGRRLNRRVEFTILKK
jgi:OmpA-OmpF porin, OOP family